MDRSQTIDTHFTLKRAIAVALENSPTLQEARLSLEIAHGQVKEAWSSVLPRLSTNASYSRSIIKQSFFFGDTLIQIGADNVWVAGITFSQPVFDAAAFIGVGASGRVRQLQSEAVRGTIQQVVTRVRQAYLDALLSAEQIRLTEQSLERVRQSLDEARSLNKAGMVSDYDVLRLDVQLSNLEADRHRAWVGEAAAGRNLLLELGLSPELEITLEGRLNELNLEEHTRNSSGNQILLQYVGFGDGSGLPFHEAYGLALEGRSDLRQLAITTSLEEAQLAAQRAEYFPTLSIFYNYNLTAQENDPLDFFGENANQRSRFAVTGINMQLPLFLGFARRARMQQRRAAVRQSELRRWRGEQRTDSQLRNLLASLEDSQYRAESLVRALDQARRGFEIATALYRTGVGSQLQITDAELALRQSEFNYARTVYDYLTLRTQLDAAMGTVPVSLAELDAGNHLDDRH